MVMLLDNRPGAVPCSARQPTFLIWKRLRSAVSGDLYLKESGLPEALFWSKIGLQSKKNCRPGLFSRNSRLRLFPYPDSGAGDFRNGQSKEANI